MNSTTPVMPLSYPFEAGELGKPPPIIEWARAHRPVCPVRLPSGAQVWMVTRKDDIARVLTDPRFSRDLVHDGAPRMVGEDFTSMPGGVFNLDPPDHTRVRAVLTPFYSRGNVGRYASSIARHATSLAADMLAGPNPCDLVDAYSGPLPLHFNCELLGVPVEHRAAYLDYFHTQTSMTATAAQVAGATATIAEFVTDVITAKRDAGPAPDQDPISALIAAHHDGRISRDELHGTVAYLFVTGSEPLVPPLSSGPFTLMRHRDQLDECLADPQLWSKAVEEVLRYHHNGVLGLPRVALDDVDIAGTTIHKGEAVCAPMLGATGDPRHYNNPERFWIHRTTDGSASFGAGPHYCLGASLARLFLATAYRTLFETFPTLHPAIQEPEVPWDSGAVFTRPVSLPVAW